MYKFLIHNTKLYLKKNNIILYFSFYILISLIVYFFYNFFLLKKNNSFVFKWELLLKKYINQFFYKNILLYIDDLYFFFDTLKSQIEFDKNIYIFFFLRYGINYSFSKLLCKYCGYILEYKYKNIRLNFILKQLQFFFFKYKSKLDVNYKIETSYFIKQWITSKSYKGYRLLHKLPVHGQRTHTNASTASRKKLILNI